jgi:hypothetical protein
LPKIVDNIANLINEPACSIYSSEILVNFAIAILEYDWLFSFIVIKVSQALMWIEVKLFNSKWQRELRSILTNTKQLVIGEDNIKCIHRSNIASVLIDEISSVVDEIAFAIMVPTLRKRIIPIMYASICISLEVTYDVIDVESSLVHLISTIFDPCLNIFSLD